jgi:hypothetical protein
MSESYYGTCNFKNLYYARKYYREYGCDTAEVDRKIADNEIHIGMAQNLKPNEKFAWDRDGRGIIIVTE